MNQFKVSHLLLGILSLLAPQRGNAASNDILTSMPEVNEDFHRDAAIGDDGEFMRHEGEFYCPLNDDGCDWMLSNGNHFCFKLFQHERSMTDAMDTCEALSIPGCTSKLISVDEIPKASKAIKETGESCPGSYRADCHYGAHGEPGWWNHGNEKIMFPEMFTGGNPDYPLDAVDEQGMTCMADFESMEILGNKGDWEPSKFACSSCAIEIPVCPVMCEECIKPVLPFFCDNGPLCTFEDECHTAYDVNDGCLARIFKPDDAPIHAFTMICAGNCTDVNIQIHNIAGALNSFQLVNPAGIELHRSGASNEFEALTFDEIVDSVVDINLMPGSNPGYVKFTDISASNLICLDLMNDMENIPIECFSPPRA